MAAENALHHDDDVKHSVENLQDLPLYGRPSSTSTASSTSSTSSLVSGTKKPRGLAITTEKTPLVIKTNGVGRKQTVEEVHPLPWFRSPEWGRESPLRQDKNKNHQKRSYRRGRGSASYAADAKKQASNAWWCFGKNGAATKNNRSDDDLEVGYNQRTGVLTTASDEGDGFRQCIQFLVGLIIVVALALIFLIIFQPFHEGPSTGW